MPLDYPASYFHIEESDEDDGTVCLALVGELDLAVADALVRRLADLRQQRRGVRVDLSRLEFIDTTGIRELMLAVSEARASRWQLEIGDELSDPVRRVIAIAGAGRHFWPTDG